MDQSQAPLLDALALSLSAADTSFAAPAHHRGRVIPSGLKPLLGKRVFAADLMTPKGLDDRTESAQSLQRAHELAAEAWGAELARYATGGSTQNLHTALAAVARPGDTVLIAANAHKAEFSALLFAGYEPVVLPVTVDAEWDIEHGVAPDTLRRALDANPAARAVIVVSPTYHGVTADIASLAALCHARGLPLLVDAAWGGAFGFSPRLPASPLALGADIVVSSLHKTMGALAQGSVLLARGGHVDLQRLALAYELFQTTSPSIPILASLDATRRDHALRGEKLWDGVLDLAADARRRLARIPGLRIWGRERLDGAGAFDLDESKITIDVARLGVTGYAVDDWLFAHGRITVGMADARHLLLLLALGSGKGDVRAIAKALKALVEALRTRPDTLPAAPPAIPRLNALGFDLAEPAARAFFGKTELVPYEACEGRVAAEIVAPAPPGIPRLVPGQRIDRTHVDWLVANRDAGMFVLDPADPAEHRIRVVA